MFRLSLSLFPNRDMTRTAPVRDRVPRPQTLEKTVVAVALSAALIAAQPSPTSPVPRPAPKFQVSRQIDRTVPAPAADSIFIANEFGNVEVAAGGSGSVRIRAELVAGGDSRAGAESCLQAMGLHAEVRGRRLDISSTHDPGHSSATQFQTSLIIAAPALAVLHVENAYGDVSVSGMQGTVLVRNRFGNSNVHRCQRAEITNAFGDVSTDHLTQGVTISSRFGNVSTHDLTGPVTIGNESGTIRLIRSSGSVQVENRLGEVSAADCRGRVHITCVQGPVVFRQAMTNPDTVTIVSHNGPIRLTLPSQPSARVNVLVNTGRVFWPQPPGPVGPGLSGTYAFGEGQAYFDLSADRADVTIVKE